MRKEELKSVWESVQIVTNENTLFSIHLMEIIANYKINDGIMSIDFLNKDFCPNDKPSKDLILEIIKNQIIANALDFEYDVKEFILTFDGETLNKAVI